MPSVMLQQKFDHYERLELQGKMVWVPRPVPLSKKPLVEREEELSQAMAAWLAMDGLPSLNFRLFGPPGTGKNALVYHLAAILKKDLYIINGHQELGPEDIACSATMTSSQMIEYVASPLFAAMLKGGICFFDEIGKAPVAALDTLASVLDDRRTLTSVLAGMHIRAHDDFLFCAALNEEEEEGLGLPGFLDERTRPAIRVGYPSPGIMEKILRTHLPMASDIWLKIFLRKVDSTLSPRSAITILSYAYRLARQDGVENPSTRQVCAYLKSASKQAGAENKKTGTS